MPRFRLRFALHELDLPQGEVLIGRSAACHLTVDDPLVSRNHARIFVGDDEATIEDLGSRNGVRVDGRAISGLVVLSDGTRLRIGTQEIVFRRVEEALAAPRRHRSTGFMVHCSSCGVPYATDQRECPNCGQAGATEETTTATEQAWSLELLIETMRRAEALDRTQDLERLLRQAKELLDKPSLSVDRRRLDQLADAAVRLASASGDVGWASWALGLFAEHHLVPRPEVGQRLSNLPPSSQHHLRQAAERVVCGVEASTLVDGPDHESFLLFSALAGQGRG